MLRQGGAAHCSFRAPSAARWLPRVLIKASPLRGKPGCNLTMAQRGPTVRCGLPMKRGRHASNTDVALDSFRGMVESPVVRSCGAKRRVRGRTDLRVPRNGWTGLDFEAMHLTAWSEDKVVAYLGVLQPRVKLAEPSIGRLITSATHRRGGVGRELMRPGVQYFDAAYLGRAGALARKRTWRFFTPSSDS